MGKRRPYALRGFALIVCVALIVQLITWIMYAPHRSISVTNRHAQTLLLRSSGDLNGPRDHLVPPNQTKEVLSTEDPEGVVILYYDADNHKKLGTHTVSDEDRSGINYMVELSP